VLLIVMRDRVEFPPFRNSEKVKRAVTRLVRLTPTAYAGRPGGGLSCQGNTKRVGVPGRMISLLTLRR